MEQEHKDQLIVAFDLLDAMPPMTYGTIYLNRCQGEVKVDLRVQAATREDVQAIIGSLPHAFWKKSPPSRQKTWWDYDARISGVAVNIYACHEAPPTCHAVKKVEVVTRKVPVEFREETVEVEMLEWVCDEPLTTDQAEALETQLDADRHGEEKKHA